MDTMMRISLTVTIFFVYLFSSVFALGKDSDSLEISRAAYFGDTHIHTRYSFDAFMFNVRTTPDDAYRYAKGEPIDHPAGTNLRINGAPLDFLMVSDHA